jgi:hypothetical protein
VNTIKHASLPLLAALVGLGGCGSMHSIKIDSDPSGATVRASGREIGTTPLTIIPDEIFPPRFVGTGYQAAGKLEIDKAGCQPYRKDVDDAVLSKDITARLTCDPAAMEQAPAPTPSGAPAPATVQQAPTVVPSVPAAPAAGSTPAKPASAVRQRLQTLESLHKDGLVTDQEYRSIRKRILDGL